MKTYPVLYTYKKTNDNGKELRYSIRSLKNLQGWNGEVFVVGDKEGWFKDTITHIKKHKRSTVYIDQEIAMMTAIADERLPDDFIYMMDDVYITEPTKLDYWHWGELKIRGNGYHHKQKDATKQWLVENGHTTLDYELHMPILLNKQKRTEVHKIVRPTYKTIMLKPRTLYGNIFNIGGTFYEDQKTKTHELPDAPIISTQYFTSQLKSLFPEPSDYEVVI